MIDIDMDGTSRLDIDARLDDGKIILAIRAGYTTLRVNAGSAETDAGTILAAKLSRAVRHAAEAQDEADNQPHEYDGFVALDRDAYHVRLEGTDHGSYPRREFAVYQLARAMAETGSFPAAWAEGEHGPSVASIEDEVRKHHDEGGTGLLPLPGARFAPGDEVIDSDGGWPCTVIFDYGDLGVHVHAQGDPDVTAIVPPGQISRDAETCEGCGLPVVKQDTGIHEDPDYPASSDEARYCDASPDHLHHQQR